MKLSISRLKSWKIKIRFKRNRFAENPFNGRLVGECVKFLMRIRLTTEEIF